MKHQLTTPRSYAMDKAVTRTAGTSPCKDCPDRYPGCSGKCEKFKGWKQRVAEVKQKFRQADQGSRDAEAVLIESYARGQEMVRRKGKPRKT